VLRRIIRRAVRHAFLLGATDPVTPALVDATAATMGAAYPEIARDHERVVSTVRREEERFRQTLERGLNMLDEILSEGDVAGEQAFFLHDTLGFPIDLTREIAAEHDRAVDVEGFESRMGDQRTRAKDAQKAGATERGSSEMYRDLLEEIGPVEFTGRQELETVGAKVRGLVRAGARVPSAEAGEVEVVLDRTPFYAESGGQVGDTGEIVTDDGARVRVTDTQYGVPDLVVHKGEVVEGVITEGSECAARVDAARRDAIRRNHTATHLLHWALREVLGAEVQQAGSLVAPDRLRFDFSHYQPVTREELDRVEALANAEVLSDAPVRHYETTKDHAESLGAVAFFGEKYGDLVRVLEAGEHSLELCGGTHVHSLGFIGPIKIVSEGSVGANLRRIEALTGEGALAHIAGEEEVLRRSAEVLKVSVPEVPERLEKLVAEVRALRAALAKAQERGAKDAAADLAATADGPTVVARVDGFSNDALRSLAIATRDALGRGVVGLIGLTPEDKVAVAVAVSKDLVSEGVAANAVAADAARTVGGGTGKQADVAVGGGPKADAVDEALARLQASVEVAADGIDR
jgi:alanyl-tRNA synthetase